MKRLAIVLIIIYLGTSCFAQSNNDTQRIVGTWKFTSGPYTSTYTFSPNGTFTFTSDSDNKSGRYFLSNGKLITTHIESNSPTFSFISDYYLSSDGRVLFLPNDNENNKGVCFYKQ